MKILVGCEESQSVTIELRKLGHEAFSCDIQECSGGHPEWHLKMDIFKAIDLKEWDMGIFFPECTYLTVSANKWYKDMPPRKSGTLVGAERREARETAINFFMRLYNCKIPKIAIENPIGVMSSRFRKPDQVLQPWMFGHGEAKGTCLWLKNLPLLIPTNYAEPKQYKCKCGNVFELELGKYGCCNSEAKPLWDNQTKSGQNKLSPSKDRAKLRSKTYPGIAKAMANQWTTEPNQNKLF
mgnify:CR=1 FL=1|tara:strand:+ start:32 stop:748 length:717 start_codon:yes stop_codon:yes gene_type:complete